MENGAYENWKEKNDVLVAKIRLFKKKYRSQHGDTCWHSLDKAVARKFGAEVKEQIMTLMVIRSPASQLDSATLGSGIHAPAHSARNSAS